ncbi:unnamed protein product [Orchesella dallaii]|uniref:Uncharacterized protein n=1 Tax=Orchesella dallaii TaxID=48710 RepID=A0ABP1R9W1_9HEXA
MDDKVKVFEETEFEQIVSINKSHKLVVLKCDTVTVEMVKNLISFRRKVVSVCRQAEDGIKGCEIVTDSQDWEDLSRKFVDKLWFRVDGSRHNAAELFSAPSMIELMGKHSMEFHTLNDRFFFNVLDCKLGHPIKKRNSRYLSNTVFSHFLPDKLVFVNINEQELRNYAKYGQRIGCVGDGEALESLHYEYDYMILQQMDMILIEKIWKQVNSSVHLIEYVRGQFKVVRSWGSQENVKRFYEPTQFCSFPFCDCPTSYNMIVTIPVSYKLDEDEQLVTLELNLNELLPKGRRVFGFQDKIDFFELERLVQGEKSIWALDFHSSTIKSQSKRYEHQIIRLVNQVVHDLSLGEHEKNMLKQVALNTLFPKFANNVQCTYTGLEKYMRMGLLEWENKNHSFMVFKHEVLAYYFLTELIVEHQDLENFSFSDVLAEVFVNCFETSLDQVTFKNQNNEKWFTKWIASYKFAHTRLFKFLDAFASKPEHADAISKFLGKTISSESVFKWIHATVHENLVNLLKLIVKLEIDDNKIFESEDIVVLAVKHDDISLIQSVMQQYKKHTNKELNDIKIPLFNHKYEFQYFITVLHIAAMKSHFSVFEFLLNHHFKDSVNQPDMKNLLYFFVAQTHEHDEVDEQKRIITNFIQNYPFVIEEEASPLTAPNIHVDLILHLFNLGVNVRATDEHKQNILHLCAKYLTPKEYDRVVNALVEKRETEIFHLKDKRQCTPLHVAVEHLELLDSTIHLFSSANVEFNAVNEENNTALIEAIFSYKSARMLDSLIHAGADDQTPRRYNRGVINFAAECSNFTALKYFIFRGHDVNAMDEDNCTPLHLALQHSTTRTHNIVVSLVQHGASVNAIDKNGQTPLKIISVFESFTRVENRTNEFLLKHGARTEMPGSYEEEVPRREHDNFPY